MMEWFAMCTVFLTGGDVMRRSVRLTLTGMVVAVLLSPGCHDAPRKNPFDPALTPTVELLDVKMDEQEGTATLVWTRYDGAMEFEEYQVHRRVAEMVSVDTVKVISSVSDTFFVDDTIAPDTEYVYWVMVSNKEGFGVRSNERESAPFSLHPVRLLKAEAVEERGEASLVWTRYNGPGFEEYGIRRLDPKTLAWEERETILSVGDTVFVDGGLLPEVTYRYRVVVRAFGEKRESGEKVVTYVLPSVALDRMHFDSRTATASLSWSRYDGPRFTSYEVWRRTESLAGQRRSWVEDVGATSFVDSCLEGNTEYVYKVVVKDSTGARSESEERSGGFHLFIDEWDLEFAPYGMVIDKEDNVYVIKRRGSDMFVVPYDLSFDQTGSTAGLSGVALKDGKVDLSPDGKGNVYVAFDLEGGDVRVFKVDSGGRKVWSDDVQTNGSRLAGIGVIGEDDLLVILSDGGVSIFDADGERLEPFEWFPSDDVFAMEVWEDSPEISRMGVIYRDLGKIWAGKVAESAGDYRLLGGFDAFTELGEGVGLGDGQLLFPMSMVKGDADRLFVVNGGAERIEVFKREAYLTRFGRAGAGPGEFVFRKGDALLGDVALDREGNVYVADPGNNRIQKFGP